MRITKANEKNQVQMKLLEITNDSNEMMKNYQKMYQDLLDLYNNYGDVYKELARVVKMPTNQDAQDVIDFNQGIKQEMQYLNDDSFLSSVLNGEQNEDTFYQETLTDNVNDAPTIDTTQEDEEITDFTVEDETEDNEEENSDEDVNNEDMSDTDEEANEEPADTETDENEDVDFDLDFSEE